MRRDGPQTCRRRRRTKDEVDVDEAIRRTDGFYLIVDGNVVGPHNARVDQGDLVRTIQAGAADTRVLAPLGPEEIPGGKHGNKDKWVAVLVLQTL